MTKKIYFTEEQLEYITDNTCKYGCLYGWNEKENCYQCSKCGVLRELGGQEKIPQLISLVNLPIKNK